MSLEIKKRLEEVVVWLQKEYVTIRTGQANPGLLDSVKVESYGTYMPIQQLGSVGIEDARTLRVSIWDASQVSAVEKAIREADLGVSVVGDSSGLRVIFPELTSERRVQLLKLAKSRLEDARISVRGVRDEEMKELERAFKATEFGEDEKFTRKEQIQKHVEETNNKLESLFNNKERELNQ
ncbi:MAG TPA: ribosome recycling factor [Candidatus Paceibacterota bacterium]|nr:ribosome recycling factor [Candidatus Paceibacterota bacterium]HMO83232.1 ribosome recycling factor [Candidatus Paceibacterota bacterium]